MTKKVQRLINAVTTFRQEAHDDCLKDDAKCDHSVGICWCGYLRKLEELDASIATVERASFSLSAKVKYVGDDTMLSGQTAIGRWEDTHKFLVQVDNPSHPWATGWHVTERHLWRYVV